MHEYLATSIATFVAVLAGGVINWWFSRLYYVKAGKQLTVEAAELRRLSEMVLRSLEQAGLANLSYDEKGKVKGIKINIVAKPAALSLTTHRAQLSDAASRLTIGNEKKSSED